MKCRFCHSNLSEEFIDLINAPASNSFLTSAQLDEPEVYYPLRVYVCQQCYLVQIAEYKKTETIFDHEYVYFSSYSSTWLAHSKKYVEQMLERLQLNEESMVIEVASNDGYLLQYFKDSSIPVLGIEPTANTARVAQQKGIETIIDFFGIRLANELASKGMAADLLLGNNVLAHVPDINDFVGGMKILLRKNGVITMEFPHLLQLIKHTQFDTIYHEHFSYLSLYTVQQIFAAAGLKVFDVEELPTHGGSLRIFATHEEADLVVINQSVLDLVEKEKQFGINDPKCYRNFKAKTLKIKLELLSFITEQNLKGKKVAAYGAAAKGNTLLNYAGLKNDLISGVVDANPNKQGKYLPGSHVPVVTESWLMENKPDYILIFPWNIKDEIMEQIAYIRDWGGQFVIPIPELTIIS